MIMHEWKGTLLHISRKKKKLIYKIWHYEEKQLPTITNDYFVIPLL